MKKEEYNKLCKDISADLTRQTYQDIFTKEQIEWLIDYERHTGFEPMCAPDWAFQEVVDKNLQHFKGWSDKMIEILEKSNLDLNKGKQQKEKLNVQYNFTHELSELLCFTSGAGTAARLFSAYSSEFAHPQEGTESAPGQVVMSLESSQDLMWITDTIHNFNSLSEAINSGNPEYINDTCDRFIDYFKWLMDHEEHMQKGTKGNPAETFSRYRFRDLIEIERAVNAISSIKSKLMTTE